MPCSASRSAASTTRPGDHVPTSTGADIGTFGRKQTDGQNNAIVAGFVAGLGIDVALMPNVFLRGEWEYIAFGPGQQHQVQPQYRPGRHRACASSPPAHSLIRAIFFAIAS